MSNWFQILLLGLVGAAIVHLAVIFLVPLYSDQNAWSRLETRGEPYVFQPIDRKDGLGSDKDPLLRAAACRFDLAGGPVRITTSVTVPFWSLSVYAPNGDNLYSINDDVFVQGKLDLIIADPIGMARLRVSEQQGENRPVMIEKDLGEGMVILRTLLPDQSWSKTIAHFFESAACRPYDPE
ncbi:hypothetical protein ACFO1V_12880 [Daeguia caeni]|uniref:DUF1254 domain-containing protein n=1 Tax=Daeguia caeni TaxID=439612 RepID=A0ABV9H9V4_9HYPH